MVNEIIDRLHELRHMIEQIYEGVKMTDRDQTRSNLEELNMWCQEHKLLGEF